MVWKKVEKRSRIELCVYLCTKLQKLKNYD